MGTTSVADYCRAVEAHLTKVNGGHLVRIVGPGFALVRAWEAEGIPLSIVERGIDLKAERHRLGAGARGGRPLRIEFCEGDVRALFEDWKRAVGVMADPSDSPEASAIGAAGDARDDDPAPARKASLSKHLERVSDRLSRLLGRQDLPEAFLEQVNLTISAVADARDRARTARGAARDGIIAAVKALDAPLLAAARRILDAASASALETQAEQELGAFRQRLGADEWQRARTATMDRLLRERYGLPVIDPDEA